MPNFPIKLTYSGITLNHRKTFLIRKPVEKALDINIGDALKVRPIYSKNLIALQRAHSSETLKEFDVIVRRSGKGGGLRFNNAPLVDGLRILPGMLTVDSVEKDINQNPIVYVSYRHLLPEGTIFRQ